MSAVKPAVLIVHNRVFHWVAPLINPQRQSSRREKYGHRALDHAAVEEINQPCLRRTAGFITQLARHLYSSLNLPFNKKWKNDGNKWITHLSSRDFIFKKKKKKDLFTSIWTTFLFIFVFTVNTDFFFPRTANLILLSLLFTLKTFWVCDRKTFSLAALNRWKTKYI